MSPDNILIVRLSAIGDALHCTPVARALRENYPHAKLSWIISEKAKDILVGNPHLDEIIVWDKDGWKNLLASNPLAAYRAMGVLGTTLKAEQYDLVVDVHAQFIPGLVTWSTGSPVRAGFSNAKELAPLFYTHKTPRKKNIPITLQYLGVLEAVGISADNTDMMIPIAPENYQVADIIWQQHEIKDSDTVVILNPSTTWATKCWPAEHFSQLANNLLQEIGIKILLTGAKSDIPLANRIKEKIHGDIIDITGCTSLKDLAAVAQRCHLFVTGDTGPLHIAAAVGTPTLSLFGPTDPQVYAPLGAQHTALQSTAACRRCHKRKCKNFHCMDQIHPSQVYQEALKMLQAGSNRDRAKSPEFKQNPVRRIPLA